MTGGLGRVPGLYLSRQGAMITWRVAEFLRLLGADEPLTRLRERLQGHLTARRATA